MPFRHLESAPQRRWATFCGSGRGSATHGVPAICRPPQRSLSNTTMDCFLTDSRICSSFLESARTRRARSWPSFERDVAVVDTNIARILARTAGERLTPKAAQERADAAVPLGDGWAWNQVFMDLGAGLCRPTPICAECPLVASCAWSAAERPDPDPAIGSAGVSGKQARFEGSRRQARGKVLKALNNGARPAADFDLQILSSLLADGLIEQFGTTVTLPT